MSNENLTRERAIEIMERSVEILDSAEENIRSLQQENSRLRSLIGLDMQRDVRDFLKRFGHYETRTPSIAPDNVRDFRLKLIREEVDKELEPAIESGSLPDIADGIVDGIYVLLGTACAYGIDIAPIWSCVHAYNMAKIPNGGAETKPLKPEGLPHPDIERELSFQGAK